MIIADINYLRTKPRRGEIEFGKISFSMGKDDVKVIYKSLTLNLNL